MIRTAEYLLRYGPQEIRSQCIDALIVDQGEPGGATLADLTGIPFISLCATLPLNSDDLLPLPIPAGQPLMRLEAPTGKAAV
jgi:hypothetical protein